MKKIYSIVLALVLIVFSLLITIQVAKADFCSSLDGLSLYSLKDHTSLGKFTNQYDSNSLIDRYGDYGSKYSSDSIFNKYGDYGSKYSDTSAWDKYASDPPIIIDDQFNIYGNLTLDQYSKYTPIHPLQALTCYISLSDDRLTDFLWALDEFDGQSKINSPKSSSIPYASLISPSCGTNSHITIDSTCICNDGYVWVDANDTKNLNCKLKQCSTNQTLVNNQCQCNAGFIMNDFKTDCIAETTTTYPITTPIAPSALPETYSTVLTSDCTQYGVGSEESSGKCICKAGYDWNPWGSYCVERSFQTDSKLISRLSGKILLQIEQNGEAWYIPPSYTSKFYLQDGSVAYQALRKFGLGITDSDLSKIPIATDTSEMKTSNSICTTNGTASRLKGNILLQVQQHGEAWYVDPVKCKRIYMQNGDAAYQIMRFLSLGITSNDLNKIATGNIDQIK